MFIIEVQVPTAPKGSALLAPLGASYPPNRGIVTPARASAMMRGRAETKITRHQGCTRDQGDGLRGCADQTAQERLTLTSVIST